MKGREINKFRGFNIKVVEDKFKQTQRIGHDEPIYHAYWNETMVAPISSVVGYISSAYGFWFEGNTRKYVVIDNIVLTVVRPEMDMTGSAGGTLGCVEGANIQYIGQLKLDTLLENAIVWRDRQFMKVYNPGSWVNNDDTIIQTFTNHHFKPVKIDLNLVRQGSTMASLIWNVHILPPIGWDATLNLPIQLFNSLQWEYNQTDIYFHFEDN